MLYLIRNARESVVDHDRLAAAVNNAVVRDGLVPGEKLDLDRVISNEGNPEPFVDAVQCRDREPMHNDREEHEPVDDWGCE